MTLTNNLPSNSRKLPSSVLTKKNSNENPFSEIKALGEGSFGAVFSAVINDHPKNQELLNLLKPGQKVAIKCNLRDKKGNRSITSISEMHMLRMVQGHPFCSQVYEFCLQYIPGIHSTDKLYDQISYISKLGTFDAKKYITRVDHKPIRAKKLFAVHLMLAVEFIHALGITHRDIKPQNIIVHTKQGVEYESLQLADFGLACYLSNQAEIYNHMTVTLSYRAPEIVLRKVYTNKLDIWSCGCVLIELFCKRGVPFTFSNSESDHLDNCFSKIAFSEADYELANRLFPGKLMNKTKFRNYQKDANNFSKILELNEAEQASFGTKKGTYLEFIDLLGKMMSSEPKTRFSASECLNHPFFEEFRSMINKYRAKFSIDQFGQRVIRTVSVRIPRNRLSENRARYQNNGYIILKNIYRLKYNYPNSIWYDHRTFCQGIQLFDRLIISRDFEKISTKYPLVNVIRSILIIAFKFFEIGDISSFLTGFLAKVPKDQTNKILQEIFRIEKDLIKIFDHLIYTKSFYEEHIEIYGPDEESIDKLITERLRN